MSSDFERAFEQADNTDKSSWSVPVALALITAGFSVVNAALLIFVPLAFMLIALPPRKPWLIVVAMILLATTFAGPTSGVLWWYGRGWALILSAWFVLAIALLPNGTMSRALLAVGGSLASTALVLLANRAGWYQLEWNVSGQLRRGAADVAAFWGARLKDKPFVTDLVNAVYGFADFQAKAYPALLGVASLSGLALAWWLWRRLSSHDRRPLAPLREFRFNDELIWLVVIGAALVLAPLHGMAARAGANVLTFMAALYALRGLAVVIALFGTPSLIGALFGVLIFLLLYPIVMATTLMVGLTDTWLDLRARRLTRQDNEKH